MQNIKLTIAYDGTDFLGWQKTSCGPSIEQALQEVLEKILQEEILLQAASRTDAGVHAYGQTVNFLTSKSPRDLPKLCISINSLLPKSIVVLEALQMPPSFHPTLDSTGKEYHYSICRSWVQLPQHRFYSWHCQYPLDLSLMRKASSHFVGHHDFSSLCNMKKQSNYRDYNREIRRVDVIELPENRIRIEIEGKNFLYKMVRNIVGTLVYVGRGKIAIQELPDILERGDRSEAGVTAPAHGLSLAKVKY